MKLSEQLQKWRAERPDEWRMDEFIKAAVKLENENEDLKDELSGDDIATFRRYE